MLSRYHPMMSRLGLTPARIKALGILIDSDVRSARSARGSMSIRANVLPALTEAGHAAFIEAREDQPAVWRITAAGRDAHAAVFSAPPRRESTAA